jgi:hypothetical protein
MLYYQSTNPSRATSLYPLHTLYMDLQDNLPSSIFRLRKAGFVAMFDLRFLVARHDYGGRQ